MSHKRLLITGASGFTGAHLIAAARERDYECIALCHRQDDAQSLQVETAVADITDFDALARALGAVQPSHVIHLAGQANVAHANAAEIYSVNVVGTINLLEALRTKARNLKRIVLASSANVYGAAESLPITEETPTAPTNHYACSKLSMESAAMLMQDLPISVARPFNYTGAGQSTKFVIPKIVEAFRDRQPVITLGNIDVSRDFSDVRDIARDYLGLLEHEALKLANFCSGVPVSVREVIGMLEEMTGHTIEIESDPGLFRSGEIAVLYGQPNPLLRQESESERIQLKDTISWMLSA